ncbi:MAG: Omp28 family outer membrane lipoprotein [Bacteroidia bacterium]
MKNKNLLPIVFFIILIFSACDFITDVYKPQPPPPPPSDSTRRVLLEDYTGHECVACPSAAVEAKKLKDIYKEGLIVIGVHAGSFAKPDDKTEFKADFRTSAGDVYDSKSIFNISGPNGNPNGLINRKNYKGGAGKGHIFSYGKWANEVKLEIEKKAIVMINIDNKYSESDRSLTCTVESTFFYDTIKSSAYNLVLCIIEDSITAPQLNSSTVIQDYVHNHVLRDNINDTWGDELVTKGEIKKSEKITKKLTYKFPAAYPKNAAIINQTPCDVKNCHIVAYIYNKDTKEVVQVAEEKVIK